MPRLSFRRDEIDLLLNLVTNRQIGLSDDRAQAEEDGDEDFIQEVQRWEADLDRLATKLVKAKVPR